MRSLSQCIHCEETYRLGFDAQHCSQKCYFKRQGRKKLNLIKHDHTICGSCGRKRATVERPKPDEAFAIEYSYDSAYNVVDGVVSYENYGQVESAKSAVGFRYPTPAEKNGGCLCGTLGRTDEHTDILINESATDRLLRIQERLKQKAIDGDCQKWPRKAPLFRTYEKTEDLEYSVGKALE